MAIGNATSGVSGLRTEIASLRSRSTSGSTTLAQQLAAANADHSSLKEQNATLEAQLSAMTDQLRQANARRPLQPLTGMSRDDVVTLADN
jgi:hypothetical protein